jgi:hypothetical protein
VGSLARDALCKAAKPGASGEQAQPRSQPATCGGMSFTADTKVLLASGAVSAISALKVGEKVLAANTKSGKTRLPPFSCAEADTVRARHTVGHRHRAASR